MNKREQAHARVLTTPELAEYEDTIMYDWDEGDEHWEWVDKAPVDEIVAWALVVETI